MTVGNQLVAVYAGSFDPPGRHHREIAGLLAKHFSDVVILPAGPRPDRPEAESLAIHRAVMADLNFRGMPNVRVELSDLERNRFTPNDEFTKRFGSQVSHVVPAAAILDGKFSRSKIHLDWQHGRELWSKSHFTVLTEAGEPFDETDLPPNHLRIEIPAHIPSAGIRSLLFDGNGAEGLLVPEVSAYIRRHGLFRPTPPARDGAYRIGSPRARLFVDKRNPLALDVATQLHFLESDDPELVIAIGGDGTMLRAIRAHWRERLPFYGLNAGHLGFLLNDREERDFARRDLRIYQLPLLWVQTTSPEGIVREELAFNDCWVERETGQTAWMEVVVNGRLQMPRVVADGMLVATAAGSTSYARAMGPPLPFNAPLLTLAGSNVLKPEFWHPAVLTGDSCVTIRNLEPGKRPLRGFIDGISQGMITEMTVRVSNIAAVELLFTKEHDPVAKLALLQFPQLG